MDTIWEVDDTRWNDFLHSVMAQFGLPAATGRLRSDLRRALNGVIHHMCNGCQSCALPDQFGSKSSVHCVYQRWESCGVLDEVWAILIDHCDELNGVDWNWPSGDAVMGKACLGGIMLGKTLRIAGRTVQNAV